VRELAALFDGDRAKFIADLSQLPPLLEQFPRTIAAPLPTMHRIVGDLHVLFVPATRLMDSRVTKGRHRGREDWRLIENIDFDPSRYARRLDVRVSGDAGDAMLWNPADNTLRPLPIRREGQATILEIDLAGAAFAIVVWKGQSPRAQPAPIPPAEEHIEIPWNEPHWAMRYEPTDLGQFADLGPTDPPGQYLPRTHTVLWSPGALDEDLATRNGLRAAGAAAQPVQLTFGPRGWSTGPAPSDSLPAPASDASDYPPKDWTPVLYSPQRGIWKDTIHLNPLGPKARVPEEFMDFGVVPVDHGVQVRTLIESDRAGRFVLAIGSTGRKTAWVNGAAHLPPDDRRVWMQPIKLKQGLNLIEFRLVSRRAVELRAHWCLLRPGAEPAFRRPEWIASTDAPVHGSGLRFGRTFTLESPAQRGTAQVALVGVGRVYLDGQLLGQQGGFDPYGLQMRVEPYPLPALDAGPHELIVEVTDPGWDTAIHVDLRTAGDRPFTLISDLDWQVSRDGGPWMPVQIDSHPWNDPPAQHLYRRPHPLPQARWLRDDDPDGIVVEVSPLPLAGPGTTQFFEWIIPPGARSMHLPLAHAGDVALWIDGQPASITGGLVRLGDDRPSLPRRALLRLRGRQLGGGAFTDAIRYDLGPGLLPDGPWSEHGLASYSGAVRLSRSFWLDAHPAALTLDLGRVRGTVEAVLNGQPLGCRFASPYRFDLAPHARRGENRIELLVTNTLGPYLHAWSPTPMVAGSQLLSGILGPVRLTRSPR
jgi:hypothetical protein